MRTKSQPVISKNATDLEEVKRRFIRQNRELAKVNSTQSLRIRSLENEVNRLQADNLQLQEQVIELRNELCNAKGSFGHGAVEKFRDQLQSKMAEMADLVNGLGHLEATYPQLELLPRERVLSPSRRQYRERQPLSELMRDAQMPTIAESKTSSRQSFDADEPRPVRLSGSSGNGSPDLGPPPTAHFDCEMPFVGGTAVAPDDELPTDSPKAADENLLPMIPLVNLETRRRRRTSEISPVEPRRCSILALSPARPEADAGTTILRTGAKRKLADRDNARPAKTSDDEFSFSRKNFTEKDVPNWEQPISRWSPHATKKSADPRAVPAHSPAKPARKALSNKSVNISPRKATVKTDDTQKGIAKNGLSKPAKPHERTQVRVPKAISTTMSHPPTATISLEDPIPEPEALQAELLLNTPATDDVFSPISSGSSLAENHTRDTPPPTDLSAFSNTTEGSQRPSRRARSAVNYAEPSLVAKMRRPGKQMVDAISGLQDPRSAMSISARKDARLSIQQTVSEPNSTTTLDPSRDPAPAPTTTMLSHQSPLRNKGTEACQRTAAETEATNMLDEMQPLSTLPIKGSSAAISTLIATSRKRKEQHTTGSQPPSSHAPASSLDDHDLYDFSASSSSPAATSHATPSTSPPTRANRRHSSALKAQHLTTTATDAYARADADYHASNSRTSSRRRSMML